MCELVLLRWTIKRARWAQRRSESLAGSRLFDIGMLQELLGDSLAESLRVGLRELRSPYHWILPATRIPSLSQRLRLAAMLLDEMKHIVWALDCTGQQSVPLASAAAGTMSPCARLGVRL